MARITTLTQDVTLQPGSHKMIFNQSFRFNGDHGLLEADNGIGKSSILESYMSIFKSSYVKGAGRSNKKGRDTVVDAALAIGWTGPVVITVDVLLDKPYRNMNEDDMILIGKVVDCGSADKIKRIESGFRFIYPHSSAIYTDQANRDKTPSQALGIEFVSSRVEDDTTRYTVKSYDEIKKLFRSRADRLITNGCQIEIFDLRNKRMDFLRSLRENYGIDMSRYVATVGEIIRQEGFNEMANFNEDQFLDLFICNPAKELFLDKRNEDGVKVQDSISDKLMKFAMTDAQYADIRDKRNYLKKKSEAFDTLRPIVAKCGRLEADLAETTDSLSMMYGQASAQQRQTIEQTEVRRNEVKAKTEEKKKVESLIASRNILHAQRAYSEASDRLESAETKMKACIQRHDDAQFDLDRDDWLTKLDNLKRARQNLESIETAIEAVRTGERGATLRNTAYTLWSLHADRLEDAKHDLKTKREENHACSAAVFDAEAAAKDAERKVASLEIKRDNLKNRISGDFVTIKKTLSSLALGTLADTEAKRISVSAFSKAVEASKDKLAHASETKLEAEAAWKDADSVFQSAGENHTQRSNEKVAAATAYNTAKLNRDAVAGEIKRLATVLQFPVPTSIDKCEERISEIEPEISNLGNEIGDLVGEKKLADRRLSDMENGQFLLPEGFEDYLRRTGIAYSTGENYLKGMFSAEDGRGRAEQALRLHPWLPAAVIVPDGKVDDMLESLKSEDIEPFTGSVPIVSQSYAMGDESSELASICFDDIDYFEDQDAYLDSLKSKTAAIGFRIDELNRQKNGIEDSIRAIRNLISRFQDKGISSMDELESKFTAAQEALETAKNKESEAELELTEARDSTTKCKQALEQAEKEEKELEERYTKLVRCGTDVKRLVGTHTELESILKDLVVAQDSVKEANSALETARLNATEAAKRLSDSESELTITQNELEGVKAYPNGQIIEGTFEKLRSDYDALKATADDEEAKLLSQRRDASEVVNKARIEENSTREEAEKQLKTYCDHFSNVDFAAEVEKRLSEDEPTGTNEHLGHVKNEKETQQALNAASCEVGYAKGEARTLGENAQKLLNDFNGNFEGYELVTDEDTLSKDFNTILRNLNREIRKLNKDKENLEGVAGKLRKICMLCSGYGIQSVLLEQFEQIDNFEDFSEKIESLHSNQKQTISDLAKVKKNLGLQANRSLKVEEKENWGEFAAFNLELNSLGKMIERYQDKAESLSAVSKELETLDNIAGSFEAHLKLEMDLHDPTFDSAIAMIMQVTGGTLRYISTLERDTDGLVKIKRGGAFKPNDETYSTAFRDKIKALLRELTDSVFKQFPNNDQRTKTLKNEISDCIVNIRSLLAFHIAITNRTAQNPKLGIEFRSTREGQRSEYLTWNQVKGESGGEGAEVFMQILIMIARSCFGSDKNRSAFLFIDNPFANLTNTNRIGVCMDLADRMNVQLIVTSQLNPPIAELSRFPYHALLRARNYANGGMVVADEKKFDLENSFIVDYRAKNFGEAFQPSLPM